MCDERERLIGYLYNDCDASERQLVDSHLETCPTCRDEIGGLRRVREDLLGWDVPEYESVWRPFAPARSHAWWRDVPVWALAAAASLVFLAGAAGGVVTYALLPPQAPPTATAELRSVPDVPTSVSFDGVSRRELTVFEQRIVDMLRAEMSERLSRAPVRTTAVPATLRVSNTDSMAGAPSLTETEHADLVRILTHINQEMVEHRRVTQGELDRLKTQVNYLGAAVVSPPGK